MTRLIDRLQSVPRAQPLGLVALLILVVSLAGCKDSSDDSGNVPARTYQTAVAETTRYIEEQMPLFDGVGLSVALVDEQGVAWAQGFGVADQETGRPVDADTAFMIGSVTKTLATAALLRAVDLELLQLDDPVQGYLPEFSLLERYPNQAEEITVRRLLNHHAGVPGDIYNGMFINFQPMDQWGCDLYTDWLFDYLASDYPSHRPGAVGSYSNTGFILAGEIAQRLLGQPDEQFGAFMQRELFEPLGMQRTAMRPVTDNRATGYAGGQAMASQEFNCVAGATGGAYSTVKDMGRFLAMLLNQGRTLEGAPYLQAGTVAMMGQAEQTPLDVSSLFQAGLGLDSVAYPPLSYAGPTWIKTGSTGDFNAWIGLLPDRGLACVVLTNFDEGALLAPAVTRKCLQAAVEDKDGLAPSEPVLPWYGTRTDTDAIAGLYAKQHGYDRVMDNGDGTLTWIVDAHSDEQETRTLFFQDRAYKYADGEERIVFDQIQDQGESYFVMIQASGSGSKTEQYVLDGQMQQILGQKIEPVEIPGAWFDRTGSYMLNNIPWHDFLWQIGAPLADLAIRDGVLLIDDSVALPAGNNLAFLSGVNNRGDSRLLFESRNEIEHLVVGGYTGLPLEAIPWLIPGETRSAQASVHENQWYRFEAPVPGQSLTVALSGEQDHYYLILYNEAFEFIDRVSGQLTIADAEGGYYLAVAATPDASGRFTLTLR
ncbi:MAG: serine hydrolase domain-containing protein [Halothiobacillaceae bacterium]